MSTPSLPLHISRIVIAKPDRLYADVLGDMCRELFSEAEIILCHTGQDALAHLQAKKVDLLLLSLNFDDTDGAELLLTVSRQQMVGHMLVFVEQRFEPILTALRTARVNAIIDVCTESLDTVKTALKGISDDRIYISPSLEAEILGDYEGPTAHTLTEAESRVLQIIGTGCDNQEAALHLGLQESTVQTHRRNIMGKLNIPTSAKLVNAAVKLGFVRIATAGIVSPTRLDRVSEEQV